MRHKVKQVKTVKRYCSYTSVDVGQWVRPDGGVWFCIESFGLERLYGRELGTKASVSHPIASCYHAWDPYLDGGKERPKVKLRALPRKPGGATVYKRKTVKPEVFQKLQDSAKDALIRRPPTRSS